MKKKIIIETVCDWFDVAPEELNNKCRSRKYVVPRQVCMYFFKQYTPMTLKEIGTIFGGSDHAAAIHSIKTIEADMGNYEAFNNDIKAIESKINQKVTL